LTALEHVLPFLALGLLAGQQGARAARWLLLVFPLGLLLGTAFAAVTPAGYWVTPLNHLSFVVLGLLLAAAWRIPLALLLALGALVGLSHGYENGRDIAGAALLLFVPGVALIGFIITALASATTLALTARADWTPRKTGLEGARAGLEGARECRMAVSGGWRRVVDVRSASCGGGA